MLSVSSSAPFTRHLSTCKVNSFNYSTHRQLVARFPKTNTGTNSTYLGISKYSSFSRHTANTNNNLTFICPCISSTSISLNYNQQDATFTRYIYFYKLFYMFQAVSPPIIRSTKLYIQHQVLSNQHCCNKQQCWFDNTGGCMYSFVFLIIGRGTA
jgi:hypothetical protein